MNDTPRNRSRALTPRIRDRYGRTVKVDKKTGEPIYGPTDNLEFTLYIKYVTGEKCPRPRPRQDEMVGGASTRRKTKRH